MASYVVTGHLVTSLWGSIEFKTSDHALILQVGPEEIQQFHLHNAQAAMEEDMATVPALDSHRLRQGTKTEAFLNLMPSIVNVMELGAQECRDALFL